MPPPPPLRKHQENQESDGRTRSWCLDKAVLARDVRYQKNACPENLPIPQAQYRANSCNLRNRHFCVRTLPIIIFFFFAILVAVAHPKIGKMTLVARKRTNFCVGFGFCVEGYSAAVYFVCPLALLCGVHTARHCYQDTQAPRRRMITRGIPTGCCRCILQQRGCKCIKINRVHDSLMHSTTCTQCWTELIDFLRQIKILRTFLIVGQ